MPIPSPHGGRLIKRWVSEGRKERLLEEAREMMGVRLGEGLIRDAENIADGAFSPLEGFMIREELESVLKEGRLPNGLAWTIPILLDLKDDEVAKGVKEAGEVALLDEVGEPLGILRVEEVYRYSKEGLCRCVYGTNDANHPGVERVLAMGNLLVGGSLELLRRPDHGLLGDYRLTPLESRELFQLKGWRSVVGFQTRNVPHLGHEQAQKLALTLYDGLFINPLVGRKKRGDFKDEVILKSYEILLKHYFPRDKVVLGVLMTDMRYAGPKEAIFHAIVRKNFGCTHFIVGRDHAGVGGYYPPYAAHKIFEEYPDLGIEPLLLPEFFYCRACDGITNDRVCPHSQELRQRFSGTDLRDELAGRSPPSFKGMLRKEVALLLKEVADPFL